MTDNNTIRVEVRFKNARLYNAILERTANLHTTQRTAAVQESNGPVAQFCIQHGLTISNRQHIYDLLNMKMGPRRKERERGGGWVDSIRPLCLTLAALLECDVAWLFPEELYAQSWPRLAKDVDGPAMLALRDAPRSALLLAPAQEEIAIRSELRDRLPDALKMALKCITPREEQVIRLRFGFAKDGQERDPQTLQEVAKILSMTQMRVRQIEAKALRKLRHPRRAEPLKPFMEALT